MSYRSSVSVKKWGFLFCGFVLGALNGCSVINPADLFDPLEEEAPVDFVDCGEGEGIDIVVADFPLPEVFDGELVNSPTLLSAFYPQFGWFGGGLSEPYDPIDFTHAHASDLGAQISEKFSLSVVPQIQRVLPLERADIYSSLCGLTIRLDSAFRQPVLAGYASLLTSLNVADYENWYVENSLVYEATSNTLIEGHFVPHDNLSSLSELGQISPQRAIYYLHKISDGLFFPSWDLIRAQIQASQTDAKDAFINEVILLMTEIRRTGYPIMDEGLPFFTPLLYFGSQTRMFDYPSIIETDMAVAAIYTLALLGPQSRSYLAISGEEYSELFAQTMRLALEDYGLGTVELIEDPELVTVESPMALGHELFFDQEVSYRATTTSHEILLIDSNTRTRREVLVRDPEASEDFAEIALPPSETGLELADFVHAFDYLKAANSILSLPQDREHQSKIIQANFGVTEDSPSVSLQVISYNMPTKRPIRLRRFVPTQSRLAKYGVLLIDQDNRVYYWDESFASDDNRPKLVADFSELNGHIHHVKIYDSNIVVYASVLKPLLERSDVSYFQQISYVGTLDFDRPWAMTDFHAKDFLLHYQPEANVEALADTSSADFRFFDFIELFDQKLTFVYNRIDDNFYFIDQNGDILLVSQSGDEALWHGLTPRLYALARSNMHTRSIEVNDAFDPEEYTSTEAPGFTSSDFEETTHSLYFSQRLRHDYVADTKARFWLNQIVVRESVDGSAELSILLGREKSNNLCEWKINLIVP